MVIDRAYIINLIRNATARALQREKDARLKLAGTLDSDNPIGNFQIKPLLVAQADARPWRFLAQAIEREGDEITALAKVREHFTRELVETAEKHTTCPVTNGIDAVQRDGWRNFLRFTDFLL